MVEEVQQPVPAIDVDSMTDEQVDELLHSYVPPVEEPPTPREQEPEITPPIEEPTIPTGTEEPEVEVEVPAEESEDPTIETEVPEIEDSKAVGEEKPSNIYSDDEKALMDDVYTSLFKDGIKASGVTRTVRDAEHLKTLVRIGLGATESNRKVKPYLKAVRSFENADIPLTPDNINFMVSVMKGEKNALVELIKNKHKLGEDDINTWFDEDRSNDKPYTPQTDYMVDEQSLAIEETLKDLETSPKYDNLMQVIRDSDDVGKQFIGANPSLINLLHSDMENGYYDKAMDEALFRMDRGTLPKQSPLLSYIAVMKDEAFYNELVGSNTDVVDATPPATPTTPKKETVVQQKRQATVNTSRSSSTNNPVNTTPVTKKSVNKMSDKEFNEFFATLDLDD